MAQENIDKNSGFVLLAYLKDFTIWDYDHGLYDQLFYFDKNCWPVKAVASHICCSPLLFVKNIKPIINALVDMHMQSHNLMLATKSKLPDVLSSYGIERHMLPTGLGGSVHLDQAKWIASQRAAELQDV